jgi:hypothetical protein
MQKSYEAVLSVLDKASAPILAIEDKLHKLATSGAHAQKSLIMSPHEKLWHDLTTHVEHARHAFGALGGKLGEIGGKLAEVLPMLGGLGAGASVAGLFEMAHATAEAAESLQQMAKISGDSVSNLQALSFAVDQTGVTTSQFTEGLGRLNQKMANAAMGSDKKTAALFAQMHIALRDANGQIRSSTEVLPELMSALEKTHSPALRNAVAMQLFGRAGRELLPFLTEGPAKLADMEAQFKKLGYSFSKSDLENLENFKVAWNEIGVAVDGLQNAISAELAPTLTPLLDQLAQWIGANRGLIATDIESIVQSLSADIKQIDFKEVLHGLTNFADDGAHLITMLGGLQDVMIGAGAVITAAFLAPLIDLTVQFGALAVSMGAPVAAAAVDAVVALTAVIPEIASFRDIWAALDLVMDANPLGIAVLAAVALGGAAYELWDHWKFVKTELVDAFDYIGTEFQKVFGPIENAIGRIGNGIGSLENDIGLGAGKQVSSPYLAKLGFPTGVATGGNGHIEAHIHVHSATPVTAHAKTGGVVGPARLHIDVGQNGLMGHQ